MRVFPPSINPVQKLSHRHAPEFVSWVSLGHAKVTISVNRHRPILSVTESFFPIKCYSYRPCFLHSVGKSKGHCTFNHISGIPVIQKSPEIQGVPGTWLWPRNEETCSSDVTSMGAGPAIGAQVLMGALPRIGSTGAIWQNNYLTVRLLPILTQMFCELMLFIPPPPFFFFLFFAFCWPG